MRKNATKIAAATLAATMLLTACSGGTAETATNNNDSNIENSGAGTVTDTDIVIAMGADIVTMDPSNQNDSTTGVFMTHVYETLLKINNDGELVSGIAESYEIVNDTDYVFKINEKATFADGTPVTAEDVKFTYERAMKSAKTQSDVAAISEIIVDSEKQVTIRLKEAYAPFATKTTDTGLGIVSKAAVEAAGETYGRDAETTMGTGPFKVAEWIPNDHYTLVANENYWGTAPIATSIEVRVIPEGSARTIALEAGEVDIVWNVDPIDCVNVEANPEVKLLSQPSSSIEYVGMNTSKEIFSDARVRKAINMALDKQVFVDTIIEGRGTIANSYINAMIPGWTDEVQAYEYNIEEAKKLMAEAGYPDGFDCDIFVNGDVRTRSAQIVQAQLAEIGINVEVSTYEWGALLEILTAGDHEMFLLGWSNSSFDADGSVFQLFHSDNHGATGNRAWVTDAEIDGLIEGAARELDHEKRMEMYKDLQLKLHDLAPWVPLYYKNDNVGVRADLVGFQLHKGANHYAGNAHYEN